MIFSLLTPEQSVTWPEVVGVGIVCFFTFACIAAICWNTKTTEEPRIYLRSPRCSPAETFNNLTGWQSTTTATTTPVSEDDDIEDADSFDDDEEFEDDASFDEITIPLRPGITFEELHELVVVHVQQEATHWAISPELVEAELVLRVRDLDKS